MGEGGRIRGRVSRVRPPLKDPNPLLQGNNSVFPPIPPFSAKNRLENNCESSSLPDDPSKIPCATEQGINSTTTGNQFATIRELIRHNRESGAKAPTRPIPIKWKPRRGRAYGSTPAIPRRLGAKTNSCSRRRTTKSRRRWSSPARDGRGARAGLRGHMHIYLNIEP